MFSGPTHLRRDDRARLRWGAEHPRWVRRLVGRRDAERTERARRLPARSGGVALRNQVRASREPVQPTRLPAENGTRGRVVDRRRQDRFRTVRYRRRFDVRPIIGRTRRHRHRRWIRAVAAIALVRRVHQIHRRPNRQLAHSRCSWSVRNETNHISFAGYSRRLQQSVRDSGRGDRPRLLSQTSMFSDEQSVPVSKSGSDVVQPRISTQILCSPIRVYHR